jgi:hypothetical protein
MVAGDTKEGGLDEFTPERLFEIYNDAKDHGSISKHNCWPGHVGSAQHDGTVTEKTKGLPTL